LTDPKITAPNFRNPGEELAGVLFCAFQTTENGSATPQGWGLLAVPGTIFTKENKL